MTDDNDILTESTKTVECEVCERLIVVPENFDKAQGTRAEIDIDMFDVITRIRFFPKTPQVICRLCECTVLFVVSFRADDVKYDSQFYGSLKNEFAVSDNRF